VCATTAGHLTSMYMHVRTSSYRRLTLQTTDRVVVLSCRRSMFSRNCQVGISGPRDQLLILRFSCQCAGLVICTIKHPPATVFQYGNPLRTFIFRHGIIDALGSSDRLLDETVWQCVFVSPSHHPRYPHNSHVLRLLSPKDRAASERLPRCLTWVQSQGIMVRSW
jgi:hypothetical protein